MEEILTQIKTNLWDKFMSGVLGLIDWLPSLIGGLIVLAIGFAIAIAVRKALFKFLEQINFDSLIDKIGIGDLINKLGIPSFSAFATTLAYWAILITFTLSAASMMGMNTVVSVITKILSYIPTLLVALAIVIIGLKLAEYTRYMVQKNASNMSQNSSRTIGNFIYGFVMAITAIIALGQIGMDTELLHSVTLVIISAIAMTLVISVGLGTREVSRNLLSGNYARESFEVGHVIKIDDEIQGTIRQVGALNTLIEDTHGIVRSIPNQRLLQETVEIIDNVGATD